VTDRSLISRGRDALLSLSSAFNRLRNTIYQQYVLRVLILGSLRLDEIRSRLSREYGISLHIPILNELLRHLGREGLIETAGVFFQIREAGKELIEKINSNRQERFDTIFEFIANRIPQDYRDDLSRIKKEILGDIICSFAEIVDEYFYDVYFKEDMYSAVESLTRTKPEPKCRIRSLDNDLRNHLERVYREIWEGRDSEDAETREVSTSLTNAVLYWAGFTRISAYTQEARNELVTALRGSTILLDTNTLIAWSCARHPMHAQAWDYLRFLGESLRVRLYYAKQTERELSEVLKRVEAAVKFLQNFPEKAAYVSSRIGHPILQEFFRERYFSWESYLDGFMRNIRRHFEIFRETGRGIKDEDVRNLIKERRLVTQMIETMDKPEGVAQHDAHLAALTKKLRESHSDWFRIIDWILTLDLKMFRYDRFLWEKEEPTSIYLTRVPYYFYAFGIADAIEKGQENVEEMASLYDLVMDATMAIETWKESLDVEIEDLAKVQKPSDLEERLLSVTRALLRAGGEEPG